MVMEGWKKKNIRNFLFCYEVVVLCGLIFFSCSAVFFFCCWDYGKRREFVMEMGFSFFLLAYRKDFSKNVFFYLIFFLKSTIKFAMRIFSSDLDNSSSTRRLLLLLERFFTFWRYFFLKVLLLLESGIIFYRRSIYASLKMKQYF